MGLVSWIKGIFGPPKPTLPSCVACESTTLRDLGPGVYLCMSCGYEGGDGYADYLKERELARYRTLDDDALCATAIDQLDDCRLTLLSAVENDERFGFQVNVQAEGLPDAEEQARLERVAAFERGVAELDQAILPIVVLAERDASWGEDLKEFSEVRKVRAWDADEVVAFVTELQATLRAERE